MATTTKPRRARRRTKAEMDVARELARENRQREWAMPLWQWEGYASYRSCASCGEVHHCRGRTYETQQCKTCYVDGAPTRREEAD